MRTQVFEELENFESVWESFTETKLVKFLSLDKKNSKFIILKSFLQIAKLQASKTVN